MRIVHEDRECLQAVATLEALGRHTCSILSSGAGLSPGRPWEFASRNLSSRKKKVRKID